MVPAVAQGIVGMTVRAGDRKSADLVGSITDGKSFVAARAERGMLAVLQGGCRVPVGAYAEVDGGTVVLRAVVASLDGDRVVRDRIEGSAGEAADLGARLGRRMLRQGAGEILEEIRLAGE
jgi:hydroxymethylbilane synthase